MDAIDETNLAKADFLNANADLAVAEKAENGWRQYVIDMDKRLMNSGPQDEREALIQTQIKALANLSGQTAQLSITRNLQKENLENAELKKGRKKRQTQVEQDLLTILAANRN
jgi:hypothetical protein